MFADSRYAKGTDTGIAHLEYCAYDHATASDDPGDSYDVGCPGGSKVYPVPPYPQDLSGYAMYVDTYPGAWSLGGNLAFSGTAPRWSVFIASVEFPLDQVPDQPPSLAPSNPLGLAPPVTSSSSSLGSLVVGRPRLRGTSVLVPVRCSGSGSCTGTLRLRPGTRSARVRLVAGARVSIRIPVASAAGAHQAPRLGSRGLGDRRERGHVGRPPAHPTGSAPRGPAPRASL
jgi:hypothetical protein